MPATDAVVANRRDRIGGLLLAINEIADRAEAIPASGREEDFLELLWCFEDVFDLVLAYARVELRHARN
jgi:hypothetical protein